MKYKAIGFDWGGVIYGQPGPLFSQGAAKILEVSHHNFQKAYFKYNTSINVGKVSTEDFWQTVVSELGKDAKYPELINYVKNQPKRQINQQVVRLIKKLKNSPYKLGLLSNNSLETANKIRQSEVAKYFDVILVSAEIGYMKPQMKAYQLFAKKLGIKPNELIYIDDTEQSLASAKNLGYYPLLYTAYQDLIKKLSNLKIL